MLRRTSAEADGAVHGTRSKAQPTFGIAEKTAEGAKIRRVPPPEKRASHSRPMRRAGRDL